MAKRQPPHREQLRIAGTERKDRVPVLDELCDQLCGYDGEAKAIREARDAAADQIVDEMVRRSLRVYVYEDRFGLMQRVTLEDLEMKVKIKRVPAPRAEPTPSVEEQN